MNTSIKNEPFVSVLTPVYNGAEYLEECIQSVLNQTYQNWEYVIVNNCSTDDTLKIAQNYAAQDARIRIHNNEEFLDLYPNHNYAFHQISPDSKYCKVVHADDWIFEDCIARMIEVGEKYPTVGVVSAYRLSGNKVFFDGLPYPSTFNSGKSIGREYLQGKAYFRAPTSILIRSSLLRARDKIYDETYHASDQGAVLELLKETDFGFVHQVLTYARIHANSATSKVAQQAYSDRYGELKIQLEYGPHFLTDKEHKDLVRKKMHIYYVWLLRNLLQHKSIEVFRDQKNVLTRLGLRIKNRKLVRYFTRELFLRFFTLIGVNLTKGQKVKLY